MASLERLPRTAERGWHGAHELAKALVGAKISFWWSLQRGGPHTLVESAWVTVAGASYSDGLLTLAGPEWYCRLRPVDYGVWYMAGTKLVLLDAVDHMTGSAASTVHLRLWLGDEPTS